MTEKEPKVQVFAEISKLRGEIGELKGSFNEFKDRMLNELSDVRKDIESLRGDIRALDTKIDRNFRWTIGIMLSILIPMWVTTILAILLRG